MLKRSSHLSFLLFRLYLRQNGPSLMKEATAFTLITAVAKISAERTGSFRLRC